VAGTAQTAGADEHAFVWTSRGGMRDLGTLGGARSTAVAINERGEVVGDAEDGSGTVRAFRWGRASGLRPVVGPEWLDASAVDLNDRGQVLGQYRTKDFWPRAFLWSPRHGARDIGDLGARYQSRPVDLNNRGQVVGRSWVTGGGAQHAFRWDPWPGRMTDLGTGEGSKVPCVNSLAVALNDRGQVAGARVDDDGDNFCQGVVWGRGPATDVPFQPAAINGRGVVVGSSAASWGDPSSTPTVPADHAFCRGARTGRTADLGEGSAVAVNRTGQVVGTAPAGGSRHAALWVCPSR
jgi:probable HAF family extracellular repeat protein